MYGLTSDASTVLSQLLSLVPFFAVLLINAYNIVVGADRELYTKNKQTFFKKAKLTINTD
jgi:hypothetical protein